MKTYSISEIRKALTFGEEQGYVLFPEIRSKTAREEVKNHPITGKWLAEILDYAKVCRDEREPEMDFQSFIAFHRDGDRARYEQPYFVSKAQLTCVVFDALYNPCAENIAFIENRLWNWCDRYTWDFPAHVPLTVAEMEQKKQGADTVIALFSAETGFNFAEMLSLVGDRLDPLLVHRLRSEIFRRIIDSYDNINFEWEERDMNWSAVCAAGVGGTAIYMVEDTWTLANIIHRLLGAFASYFAGFDSAGLTPEGVTYWGYGFGFFLRFAQLLYERTAGKMDIILDNEQIFNIATFPPKMLFSDGYVVNFSDMPTNKWGSDLSIACLLQKKYGKQFFPYRHAELQVARGGGAKWLSIARLLFWSKDYDPKTTVDIEVGHFYFAESQWLISKQFGRGNKLYGIAVKGGHNDEPHNHNDLGHFILHDEDGEVFCDLGAGAYTKQYFDVERYTFMTTSSLGHSVPCIDGIAQASGRAYTSHIVSYQENDTEVVLVMDITKAYSCDALECCQRTFQWKFLERKLILKDRYLFAQEGHTVQSMFMTRRTSVVEKNVVALGGARLLFHPADTCIVERVDYVKHDLSQGQVYRINIATDIKEKEAEILFEITI